MSDNLIKHIRKFVPLSAEEAEIILLHVRTQTLRNKEFVLTQGQVCNANYFVLEGCMRMFIQAEKGVEQIVQFGVDNWWITDLTSLSNGMPSSYNIQSVQKTSVAIVDKAVQEELFKKVPMLERYFRLIYQRAFAASTMRLHYIFNFSGEERYRNFVDSFPDFVQRVPQYMLASYLGFTPEFLSKLRATSGRTGKQD